MEEEEHPPYLKQTFLLGHHPCHDKLLPQKHILPWSCGRNRRIRRLLLFLPEPRHNKLGGLGQLRIQPFQSRAVHGRSDINSNPNVVEYLGVSHIRFRSAVFQLLAPA